MEGLDSVELRREKGAWCRNPACAASPFPEKFPVKSQDYPCRGPCFSAHPTPGRPLWRVRLSWRSHRMNPLFAALTAVVLSLMVVGGDASAAHKPAHETSARKSAPAAKQSSKHADKKAEKKAEKKSAKKVDKKADKKAEKQHAKQADKSASKAVSSRSAKSKAVESKAVESVSKGQRQACRGQGRADASPYPGRTPTRSPRRP
ncbi:MAG TPA: hypothetical protein PLC55_15155 [Zoogloea sp.]|nr:hypothetical protein [Zoogloea sp.]